MVSTTEVFTYNIPMLPGPFVTVKNPSARKALLKYSEVLDIKNNFVCRLDADKPKCRATRAGIMLWSSIPNRQNKRTGKKYLYNWIIKKNSDCSLTKRKQSP